MDAAVEIAPPPPRVSPSEKPQFLPPIGVSSQDLGMYALAQPSNATLLDTSTGHSVTSENSYQQISSMWAKVADYYTRALPDAISTDLSDPFRPLDEKHNLIDMINVTPREQQQRLRSQVTGLITSILNDPNADPGDIDTAIAQIPASAPELIPELIIRVFDDPDIPNRRVVRCIPFAPAEQIPTLIEKVLDEPGIAEKDRMYELHDAINCIGSAPPGEVGSLIARVLDDPKLDKGEKKLALRFAFFAPADEAQALLERACYDDFLIQDIRGPEIANWRQLAADHRPKKLPPIFNTNPLPTNPSSEIPRESSTPLPLLSPLHEAAREDEIVKFDKTGTETFILPRDTEASVRVIPAASFKSWIDSYLNPAIWREAGFDYVPIEPIVNFRPDDTDPFMVQVTTLNLRGVSLAAIMEDYSHGEYNLAGINSSEDIDKFQDIRKRIIETLNIRIGTKHNHAHEGNFVVLPHITTDDQGIQTIDYARTRIYMIDFDQAVSPSKKDKS